MRRKACFGAICFCALLSIGNTQGLADTAAVPDASVQAAAGAGTDVGGGARPQDGTQIESVIEQYETAHALNEQPADAAPAQGADGTADPLLSGAMPGETAEMPAVADGTVTDAEVPAGNTQDAAAPGGGETAGTAETEASIAERILLEEPKEEEDQEEEEAEDTKRDKDAGKHWSAEAVYMGSPHDPVNEIYAFLRDEIGFNHAAAVGVLANIKMESDFNATAVGDSGSSYGLCQWHNERYSRLVSYCNGNGLDYSSVHGQMCYLQHELTSYQGVVDYLYGVPDSAQGAYDAAAYWCRHFEAPANTEARSAERGSYAMDSLYGQDFYYPAEPETEMDIGGTVASIRSSMEEGVQEDPDETADSIRPSVEDEAQEDLGGTDDSVLSPVEDEAQEDLGGTDDSSHPSMEEEAQDATPEEDTTDVEMSKSYIEAILTFRGL